MSNKNSDGSFIKVASSSTRFHVDSSVIVGEETLITSIEAFGRTHDLLQGDLLVHEFPLTTFFSPLVKNVYR
jgi:hypothetical protein